MSPHTESVSVAGPAGALQCVLDAPASGAAAMADPDKIRASDAAAARVHSATIPLQRGARERLANTAGIRYFLQVLIRNYSERRAGQRVEVTSSPDAAG